MFFRLIIHILKLSMYFCSSFTRFISFNFI
nr:MAG TPA: hypothetical protein [Bacteriophage sp.]